MLRGESKEIEGIPIQDIRFGETKNMPDPDSTGHILYIVSMPLADQLAKLPRSGPLRSDLYLSDSSEAIRNSDGQIVGVPRLLHYQG